jgi:hypothetical protein
MTPPTLEGWFRPLVDGRLEVFLRGNDVRLRASADPDEIYELVDWFETQTGLVVNGPDSPVWTRKRHGPRPIQGQLNLMEVEQAPNVEAEDGDLPDRLGVD